MKILYVEDNEDNIYMLERRLKRAGFDVLIARDGAQGVQMTLAEQPDLVLMDMGLPVLDGAQATSKIKAAQETRHIPGDRADGQRHGRRQGKVHGRGLRRLRHQARRLSAPARQNPGIGAG